MALFYSNNPKANEAAMTVSFGQLTNLKQHLNGNLTSITAPKKQDALWNYQRIRYPYTRNLFECYVDFVHSLVSQENCNYIHGAIAICRSIHEIGAEWCWVHSDPNQANAKAERYGIRHDFHEKYKDINTEPPKPHFWYKTYDKKLQQINLDRELSSRLDNMSVHYPELPLKYTLLSGLLHGDPDKIPLMVIFNGGYNSEFITCLLLTMNIYIATLIDIITSDFIQHCCTEKQKENWQQFLSKFREKYNIFSPKN